MVTDEERDAATTAGVPHRAASNGTRPNASPTAGWTSGGRARVDPAERGGRQHARERNARPERREPVTERGGKAPDQGQARIGQRRQQTRQRPRALLRPVRTHEQQAGRLARDARDVGRRQHAVRDHARRARQLASLGLADRDQCPGAGHDSPAQQAVEELLGPAVLAVMRVGAVRAEHPRQLRRREDAPRGDGQAAAVAVQVREIDGRRQALEEAAQAAAPRQQPPRKEGGPGKAAHAHASDRVRPAGAPDRAAQSRR